jgi:hypothetical protein
MILPGRTLDLGLAGLAAAQLGASAWLVPAGDQVVLPSGASLGGLCWFRSVFDLDCPFCGMTRSFVALAHGDIAASVRFHPAGPLLFVAMAIFLAGAVTVAIRRGRPLVERRGFTTGFQTVALVCLAIGVLKMVRS